MTSAEARFSKSLRPRKPEGSLGRTAQDVHLDSHTAPELCAPHPQAWTYWAIRRSWFAGVNALCNLSRKKSREVAAHFRADF